MSMNLPPALAKLFSVVTGMKWPEAKEDDLRAAGDDYLAISKDMPELRGYLEELATRCREEFEGEAAEAYVDRVQQLIGGTGGTDYITAAQDTAKQLADYAHKVANYVEYTKWMIVAQLIQLAAQIAWAIACIPITFGGSLAEIFAAELVAREVIKQVFIWLLKQIALHEFLSITTGIVMDLIIQGIQIGKGHKDKFDKDTLIQAIEFGAINGLLTGPLELLTFGLGKLFGRIFGGNIGNILKNDLKGLGKSGLGDLAKGLEKNELNALTKTVGGGLKGAGSGLGRGLERDAAKEIGGNLAGNLGKDLGKDLGHGVGGSLGKDAAGGLGKGAAGGLTKETADKVAEKLTKKEVFAKELASAFESHLEKIGIENGVAREAAQKFAKTMIENGARYSVDLGAVRKLLNAAVGDAADAGTRQTLKELSNRVVQLLDHMPPQTGMQYLYKFGEAVGGSLRGGLQNILTEGSFNLVFGEEHTFHVTAETFLAGVSMGVIGHLGHVATGPLRLKFQEAAARWDAASAATSDAKYYGLGDRRVQLAILANLSGHPTSLLIPRPEGPAARAAREAMELQVPHGGDIKVSSDGSAPPAGQRRTADSPMSTESSGSATPKSTGSQNSQGSTTTNSPKPTGAKETPEAPQPVRTTSGDRSTTTAGPTKPPVTPAPDRTEGAVAHEGGPRPEAAPKPGPVSRERETTPDPDVPKERETGSRADVPKERETTPRPTPAQQPESTRSDSTHRPDTAQNPRAGVKTASGPDSPGVHLPVGDESPHRTPTPDEPVMYLETSEYGHSVPAPGPDRQPAWVIGDPPSRQTLDAVKLLPVDSGRFAVVMHTRDGVPYRAGKPLTADQVAATIDLLHGNGHLDGRRTLDFVACDLGTAGGRAGQDLFIKQVMEKVWSKSYTADLKAVVADGTVWIAPGFDGRAAKDGPGTGHLIVAGKVGFNDKGHPVVEGGGNWHEYSTGNRDKDGNPVPEATPAPVPGPYRPRERDDRGDLDARPIPTAQKFGEPGPDRAEHSDPPSGSPGSEYHYAPTPEHLRAQEGREEQWRQSQRDLQDAYGGKLTEAADKLRHDPDGSGRRRDQQVEAALERSYAEGPVRLAEDDPNGPTHPERRRARELMHEQLEARPQDRERILAQADAFTRLAAAREAAVRTAMDHFERTVSEWGDPAWRGADGQAAKHPAADLPPAALDLIRPEARKAFRALVESEVARVLDHPDALGGAGAAKARAAFDRLTEHLRADLELRADHERATALADRLADRAGEHWFDRLSEADRTMLAGLGITGKPELSPQSHELIRERLRESLSGAFEDAAGGLDGFVGPRRERPEAARLFDASVTAHDERLSHEFAVQAAREEVIRRATAKVDEEAAAWESKSEHLKTAKEFGAGNEEIQRARVIVTRDVAEAADRLIDDPAVDQATLAVKLGELTATTAVHDRLTRHAAREAVRRQAEAAARSAAADHGGLTPDAADRLRAGHADRTVHAFDEVFRTAEQVREQGAGHQPWKERHSALAEGLARYARFEAEAAPALREAARGFDELAGRHVLNRDLTDHFKSEYGDEFIAEYHELWELAELDRQQWREHERGHDNAFGRHPEPDPHAEPDTTTAEDLAVALRGPARSVTDALDGANGHGPRPGLHELTPTERTETLRRLTPDERRALRADQDLVEQLGRLDDQELARTTAELLVDVDERANDPGPARREAVALVSRMLRDRDVALALLGEDHRVHVVPKDVPLTGTAPFRHLAGTHGTAPGAAGRPYETARGASDEHDTAITEENLSGESTTVGPVPHHPDGYSTATHEIAHAVHRVLPDADRNLITESFRRKQDQGDDARWPDGPLRDGPGGTEHNYSSRSEHEYFAQLTNAYLGTNHGADPYTGLARNNGPGWVHRNESPAVRGLLERLYGPDPVRDFAGRANPVHLNEGYEGLRFLMGEGDAYLDHVPLPEHPPTTGPLTGPTATRPEDGPLMAPPAFLNTDLVTDPAAAPPPQVPQRITLRGLSRTDVLMGLDGTHAALIKDLTRSFKDVLDGHELTAKHLAESLFGPETLRAKLTALSRGEHWTVPFEAGPRAGTVRITADLGPSSLLGRIAGLEVEYGTEKQTSVALAGDKLLQGTLGVQGNVKVGNGGLTLGLTGQYGRRTGSAGGDASRNLARAKTTDEAAVYELPLTLHVSFEDLTVGGLNPFGTVKAENPQPVRVSAHVAVPRWTWDLPPAADAVPLPAVLPGNGRITGAHVLAEVWPVAFGPHRVAAAPAVHTAGGQQHVELVDLGAQAPARPGPKGMDLFIAGFEAKARTFFGEDWPSLRERLLEEVDLDTLHHELKSLMSGEELRVTLGSDTRPTGTITFRDAAVHSVEKVTALRGDTELYVATGTSRAHTDQKTVSTGLQVPFTGTGSAKKLGGGGGATVRLGSDDVKRHGGSDDLSVGTKPKVAAREGEGVATIQVLFDRPGHLRAPARDGEDLQQRPDTAEARLGFRTVVEAAEFPDVQQPAALETVPVLSPHPRLPTDTVVRDLVDVSPLHSALDAIGRRELGAFDWAKVRGGVLRAFSHAAVSAHVVAMTHGVPLRTPLAEHGPLSKLHIEVTARLLEAEYRRHQPAADLSVVRESSAFDGRRGLASTALAGNGQFFGKGSFDRAVKISPQGTVTGGAEGQGRSGWLTGTSDKNFANGKLRAAQALYDATVRLTLTVNGRPEPLTPDLRFSLSKEIADAVFEPLEHNPHVKLPVVLGQSHVVLSLGSESAGVLGHVRDALGLTTQSTMEQRRALAELERHLDPAALTAALARLTRGGRIELTVDTGAWKGAVEVTADPLGLTGRRTVASFEFELGSQQRLTVGHAMDRRVRLRMGGTTKVGFGPVDVFSQGSYTRESSRGLITERTAGTNSRAKSTESAQLFNGDATFNVVLKPKGGDETVHEVTAPVVVAAPTREVFPTAPEEPLKLPDDQFGSSDVISRVYRVDPNDPYGPSHGPAAVRAVVDDLAPTGRKVLGGDWPKMEAKLLEALDFDKLHAWLKPMTAGHEVVLTQGRSTVRITASVVTARRTGEVNNPSAVEFNTGTNLQTGFTGTQVGDNTGGGHLFTEGGGVRGTVEATGTGTVGVFLGASGSVTRSIQQSQAHTDVLTTGSAVKEKTGADAQQTEVRLTVSMERRSLTGLGPDRQAKVRPTPPGRIPGGQDDTPPQPPAPPSRLQEVARALRPQWRLRRSVSESTVYADVLTEKNRTLASDDRGRWRSPAPVVQVPPAHVFTEGLGTGHVLRWLGDTRTLNQLLREHGQEFFGGTDWRALERLVGGGLGHAQLSALFESVLGPHPGTVPPGTQPRSIGTPALGRRWRIGDAEVTATVSLLQLEYHSTHGAAGLSPANESGGGSRSTRTEGRQYDGRGQVGARFGPPAASVGGVTGTFGGAYQRRGATVTGDTGKLPSNLKVTVPMARYTGLAEIHIGFRKGSEVLQLTERLGSGPNGRRNTDQLSPYVPIELDIPLAETTQVTPGPDGWLRFTRETPLGEYVETVGTARAVADALATPLANSRVRWLADSIERQSPANDRLRDMLANIEDQGDAFTIAFHTDQPDGAPQWNGDRLSPQEGVAALLRLRRRGQWQEGQTLRIIGCRTATVTADGDSYVVDLVRGLHEALPNENLHVVASPEHVALVRGPGERTRVLSARIGFTDAGVPITMAANHWEHFRAGPDGEIVVTTSPHQLGRPEHPEGELPPETLERREDQEVVLLGGRRQDDEILPAPAQASGSGSGSVITAPPNHLAPPNHGNDTRTEEQGPAAPPRIADRGLAHTDVLIGLEGLHAEVVRQLADGFRQALRGQDAAARTLAESLFAPGTLRAKLIALSRGESWTVPFSAGGWSGTVRVDATLEPSRFLRTLDAFEFEYGSEKQTSAALTGDRLHQGGLTLQGGGKLGKDPKWSLSATFGVQRGRQTGWTSGEADRELARAKTTEKAAVFELPFTLKVTFEDAVPHHLSLLPESFKDRSPAPVEVTVDAYYAVPNRETEHSEATPPPTTYGPVPGGRLTGDHVLAEVWAVDRLGKDVARSRFPGGTEETIPLDDRGDPAPQGPGHQGGGAKGMALFVKGFERAASEFFGGDWAAMKRRLLEEVDLDTLHRDLKSLMSGETLTVELDGVLGKVGSITFKEATIGTVDKVTPVPSTEFFLGTGTTRAHVDQRTTGTGFQFPLPLSTTGMGKNAGGGIGAGGRFGLDRVERHGDSDELAVGTKNKVVGSSVEGVAVIKVEFTRTARIREFETTGARDEAVAHLGFRTVVEQAELVAPVPSEPRNLTLKDQPGYTGLPHNTVVRDLRDISPLHRELDRIGRRELGATTWSGVRADVLRAFSHAAVSARLVGMTHNTPLRTPTAEHGPLSKLHVEVTADLTAQTYRRKQDGAEVNTVRESGSSDARRRVDSDTKNVQVQVPLKWDTRNRPGHEDLMGKPFKDSFQAGPSYGQEVRDRDGRLTGASAKDYASGKLKVPQALHDATVTLTLRVNGRLHDRRVDLEFGLSTAYDAPVVTPLEDGHGLRLPVVLGPSHVVLSVGRGTAPTVLERVRAGLNLDDATTAAQFKALSRLEQLLDPTALTAGLSRLTRGGAIKVPVDTGTWRGTVEVTARPLNLTGRRTVADFEFEVGSQRRTGVGVQQDTRTRRRVAVNPRGNVPHVSVIGELSHSRDTARGLTIERTAATSSRGKATETAELLTGDVTFDIVFTPRKSGGELPDATATMVTEVAVPKWETEPAKEGPLLHLPDGRLGSSDIVRRVYHDPAAETWPAGVPPLAHTDLHEASTTGPKALQRVVGRLDAAGRETLGSDWKHIRKKLVEALDFDRLHSLLKPLTSGDEILVKHGRSTARITAAVVWSKHTANVGTVEFNTGTGLQTGFTETLVGSGSHATTLGATVLGTTSPLARGVVGAVVGGGVNHTWSVERTVQQSDVLTTGTAVKEKVAADAQQAQVRLTVHLERRSFLRLGPDDRTVLTPTRPDALTRPEENRTPVHNPDLPAPVPHTGAVGRPLFRWGFRRGVAETVVHADLLSEKNRMVHTDTQAGHRYVLAGPATVHVPPSSVFTRGLGTGHVVRWIGDTSGLNDLLRVKGPEFFGTHWTELRKIVLPSLGHTQLSALFHSAVGPHPDTGLVGSRPTTIGTPSTGTRFLVGDSEVTATVTLVQLEYHSTHDKAALSPANETGGGSRDTRLDGRQWNARLQGGVQTAYEATVDANGTATLAYTDRGRGGVVTGDSVKLPGNAKVGVPMARYTGYAKVELTFRKGDTFLPAVPKPGPDGTPQPRPGDDGPLGGLVPFEVDIPLEQTRPVTVPADQWLQFTPKDPAGEPLQRLEQPIRAIADSLTAPLANSRVHWLADPAARTDQRLRDALATVPHQDGTFTLAFHTTHADGAPQWNGEKLRPEHTVAVLLRLREQGVWQEGQTLRVVSCRTAHVSEDGGSYLVDVVRGLHEALPNEELHVVASPDHVVVVPVQDGPARVVAAKVGFTADGRPTTMTTGHWEHLRMGPDGKVRLSTSPHDLGAAEHPVENELPQAVEESLEGRDAVVLGEDGDGGERPFVPPRLVRSGLTTITGQMSVTDSPGNRAFDDFTAMHGGGPLADGSPSSYLTWVRGATESPRRLAFVVNSMTSYRDVERIEDVIRHMLDGLDPNTVGRVAIVVGINAHRSTPPAELAAAVERARVLVRDLAVPGPGGEPVRIPVAVVSEVFEWNVKRNKDGTTENVFPYGAMRNRVLDHEVTHRLIDTMMEQGYHPYLSVQDYDVGSRRVPSGLHVFDHFEQSMERPQARPDHPKRGWRRPSDWSESESETETENGSESMDLDPDPDPDAVIAPDRPLAFSGGYRIPVDGPDRQRLIDDVNARIEPHEAPSEWHTEEGRQRLIERWERSIREDMIERDWQASYAPLLPYAPEPNLLVDGAALKVRDEQGNRRLQWGQKSAEFEELGRRLNRLNAWELRQRYEALLDGLPETVPVPKVETTPEHYASLRPDADEPPVTLPQGRDEVVEQARADASNNRLPHRGTVFRTDFVDGAVVTDLSRLVVEDLKSLRAKEDKALEEAEKKRREAEAQLAAGRKPRQQRQTVKDDRPGPSPNLPQSHVALTGVLGRLISNDTGEGGSTRGAKKGVKPAAVRDKYDATDRDWFEHAERLRAGRKEEWSEDYQENLGTDGETNKLSHSVSVPIDSGPLKGIHAGIQPEHRLLMTQALALSTPAIRLGRRLAHLLYSPELLTGLRASGENAPGDPFRAIGRVPADGDCLYHAVNALLHPERADDALSLRNEVVEWMLAPRNLVAVTEYAQAFGENLEDLFLTIALTGNWNTRAGDLVPRVVASALNVRLHIDDGRRVRTVGPLSGTPSREVHLSLSDDHYSPVRLTGDDFDQPQQGGRKRRPLGQGGPRPKGGPDPSDDPGPSGASGGSGTPGKRVRNEAPEGSAETETADTTVTAPAPAPTAPPRPVHELVRELELLGTEARRELRQDAGYPARLRDSLPQPRDFADAAARLLVHVDPRTHEPVSARNEAYAQLARLLRDPEVAERMLAAGVEVVVVPKDVPITEVPGLEQLRGRRAGGDAGDGRSWQVIRGASVDLIVAITEENLRGGYTTVGGHRAQPEGYSTATHELAHAVLKFGLSEEDRALVEDVYLGKRQADGLADVFGEESVTTWPDGSRHDRGGNLVGNYSATDVHEYFAQLTNTYLGTNHGNDPTTRRPRNNGADWVREHEPELLPLLERLYGPDPQGDHPAPANPVSRTRAEEERLTAFREFNHLVDGEPDLVREEQPHPVTEADLIEQALNPTLHASPGPKEEPAAKPSPAAEALEAYVKANRAQMAPTEELLKLVNPPRESPDTDAPLTRDVKAVTALFHTFYGAPVVKSELMGSHQIPKLSERYRSLGVGDAGLRAAEQQVRRSGPGAYALVKVGDSRMFALVHDRVGALHWVDAANGRHWEVDGERAPDGFDAGHAVRAVTYFGRHPDQHHPGDQAITEWITAMAPELTDVPSGTRAAARLEWKLAAMKSVKFPAVSNGLVKSTDHLWAKHGQETVKWLKAAAKDPADDWRVRKATEVLDDKILKHGNAASELAHAAEVHRTLHEELEPLLTTTGLRSVADLGAKLEAAADQRAKALDGAALALARTKVEESGKYGIPVEKHTPFVEAQQFLKLARKAKADAGTAASALMQDLAKKGTTDAVLQKRLAGLLKAVEAVEHNLSELGSRHREMIEQMAPVRTKLVTTRDASMLGQQKNDAEVNIMRQVYASFGSAEFHKDQARFVRGTLMVASSQGTCDSCKDVVGGFNRYFPHVEVIAVYAKPANREYTDQGELNRRAVSMGTVAVEFDIWYGYWKEWETEVRVGGEKFYYVVPAHHRND